MRSFRMALKKYPVSSGGLTTLTSFLDEVSQFQHDRSTTAGKKQQRPRPALRNAAGERGGDTA
jgi:hypothetical protein